MKTEKISFFHKKIGVTLLTLLIATVQSSLCMNEEQTRAIKKPWTCIVYMAADNDLRNFAMRNIKQMCQIGSNERINIVVQLDIKMPRVKKTTQRFLITREGPIQVNTKDPYSQSMDSGKPETLISCCKWAIENYPATNYALMFWNHGSGIIDPNFNRVVCASELFRYNSTSNQLELDRSIGFLDFMNTLSIQSDPERGICWDDSTGNYLTNQKLDAALNTICSTLLENKKFSLIGFDACLMSMLEVADIVKNYAHVMTASEEVELGTGLDYSQVLHPFLSQIPSPQELGAHITASYAFSYQKITSDYTHSALNLDRISLLEHNVHKVSQLLISCLQNQRNSSVKQALAASRNKNACTHFDEPSYIDLHHFYRNVLNNLKTFAFKNGQQNALINQLHEALTEGCLIIEDVVIANVAGRNLSNAKGIAIYFPERGIHPSYRKTTFAQNNSWAAFLNQFMLL
jgi:hypothetical protein